MIYTTSQLQGWSVIWRFTRPLKVFMCLAVGCSAGNTEAGRQFQKSIVLYGTSVSGSLGYLGTVDWSVGGDCDGYITPVSKCVKCREVAWEEGANTVVEVPVLKMLAYTCTLPRPQSGWHAAFVEH